MAIMKRTILNLVTRYPLEEIETALVQKYIESSGIKVNNNEVILEIANADSNNISSIKEQIMSPNKLDDLVQLFELLIPPDDRKLNGAFFTPTLITNFMANEMIQSTNSTICDPSCGCGAFLVACVRRLQDISGKSVKTILEENIFGTDILQYSVRRCKILLSLLALSNGEDVEHYNFNVVSADSLTSDWTTLFPRKNIKSFDIVIGNPPYVKFQDLPVQLRKDLYQNWATLRKGTYNLYFAFFELGVSLLNGNGKLGYIVPNNYFTSLAGINLRRYLQNYRLIEKIIDFNHVMIFDVQTYTCLTFLSKTNNRRTYFEYERITEPHLLKQLNSLHYSQIYYDNLNTKKWRLLRDRDKDNITKIENQPHRLGDIMDIHVGIATLKDSIYFVEGANYENRYYKKTYGGSTFFIEETITRPIAKISDFNDEQDLKKNSRRIIFPYIIYGKDVKLISESTLKKEYPRCYEYLLSVKPELASRDKGKTDYPAWYAYARTQGLAYHGSKLLTPTFSSKPRFLLDTNEDQLFCNGYGIYQKKHTQTSFFEQVLNLEILQKILNSIIMEYYAFQTSYTIEGGYPCYQKNFIELFGIPEFGDKEIEFLCKENDKSIVDKFLINKYGLSL